MLSLIYLPMIFGANSSAVRPDAAPLNVRMRLPSESVLCETTDAPPPVFTVPWEPKRSDPIFKSAAGLKPSSLYIFTFMEVVEVEIFSWLSTSILMPGLRGITMFFELCISPARSSLFSESMTAILRCVARPYSSWYTRGRSNFTHFSFVPSACTATVGS